ncbi:MAG: protein kinase [Ardenticatenaceae bacterium]|nr:protein kinase [Ardenticatenaceae bacterium]
MSEEKKTLLNGRYELIDRIGAGGMAMVYRATDTRLGREVAIKMLHEGFMNDEAFVRQFQREAHSAANLTHPNIVTVHDMGEDRGRFYMVQEYIKGQTLKHIIRDQIVAGEPMAIRRAVDLIIQMCRGVGYAHRAGLVHCDVKPQNILVTPDNRVKVADFGIARAMTQVTGVSSDMIWGTPQYLSPEQAAGESPSPASDVYAIGIIMYELFTNTLPFTAESPTAIALMHIQEYPKEVRELNPLIPETLGQIVHKVLAKEPAGRYRTAGQLGRILDNYLALTFEATGPVGVTKPNVVDPPAEKTVVSTAPPPKPIRQRPTPQRLPPAKTPQSEEQTTVIRPAEEPSSGLALLLGVLALILWLGLIPLWFLVGRAWNIF